MVKNFKTLPILTMVIIILMLILVSCRIDNEGIPNTVTKSPRSILLTTDDMSDLSDEFGDISESSYESDLENSVMKSKAEWLGEARFNSSRVPELILGHNIIQANNSEEAHDIWQSAVNSEEFIFPFEEVNPLSILEEEPPAVSADDFEVRCNAYGENFTLVTCYAYLHHDVFFNVLEASIGVDGLTGSEFYSLVQTIDAKVMDYQKQR